MKIAILTQALKTNYGGLLQAYALQVVLKGMGHEVVTIQRKYTYPSMARKILSILKRMLLFRSPLRVWMTCREQAVVEQYTKRFVDKNISVSAYLDLEKAGVCREYDCFIVGSDQVWRPEYNIKQSQLFLDFTEGRKVKRVAYAASFGVDCWEFTPKETMRYSSMIQQFDVVSVREDSGVRLCKEYLHVDAIHLLDPTLLLEKEDYIRLVKDDKISSCKGKSMMAYILDSSRNKQEIVQKVSDLLGLAAVTVMPPNDFTEVGAKGLRNCIFPPVTEWIQGYMDAEYVVTDSFHGTVFAILFNKPFLVIGNNKRGLSRFVSLLKLFNLQERLVNSYDDVTDELIQKDIDFSEVNRIRREEQMKAIEFLNRSLRS